MLQNHLAEEMNALGEAQGMGVVGMLNLKSGLPSGGVHLDRVHSQEGSFPVSPPGLQLFCALAEPQIHPQRCMAWPPWLCAAPARSLGQTRHASWPGSPAPVQTQPDMTSALPPLGLLKNLPLGQVAFLQESTGIKVALRGLTLQLGFPGFKKTQLPPERS